MPFWIPLAPPLTRHNGLAMRDGRKSSARPLGRSAGWDGVGGLL